MYWRLVGEGEGETGKGKIVEAGLEVEEKGEIKWRKMPLRDVVPGGVWLCGVGFQCSGGDQKRQREGSGREGMNLIKGAV